MCKIDFEPSGCNCANISSYDKAQINAACTQALKLASEKQTVSRDKYPHVYSGMYLPLDMAFFITPSNLISPTSCYEKFQFSHAQKPYLEFPVLTNKSDYTGNESPGADRVIIGSIATGYQSAVFCAVITHDGSKKNGFAECKDDTVNPNGSGTYEGNEPEDDVEEGAEGSEYHERHHHKKHGRRGREPEEGRSTLDRIDY